MVVNKKPNAFATQQYERLRENIKNMKAVTDNKPPILKVASYLKIANIAQDKAKLKSNLRANFEMLEIVNVIQRTTGFVDSFMAPPRFGNQKSVAEMKIKRIQSLEKTNKELFKKFNGMVSMFDH